MAALLEQCGISGTAEEQVLSIDLYAAVNTYRRISITENTPPLLFLASAFIEESRPLGCLPWCWALPALEKRVGRKLGGVPTVLSKAIKLNIAKDHRVALGNLGRIQGSNKTSTVGYQRAEFQQTEPNWTNSCLIVVHRLGSQTIIAAIELFPQQWLELHTSLEIFEKDS
jgi:hypothetical protein